ncbi:hypothetical protein P691DRAFT_432464 [Macrolepiota fuliginosa MF-IS2]|uniref:Uncharacterized protein n=1 Tax=Macrolepiota fuliginosa MF-IS2 TaxID=1400762 RepID=A0A9P5XI21_9AGAR|nr:hypothetical protein P691DRAFT_432464 [Macrolepiota fuliginosa MF-IS2]
MTSFLPSSVVSSTSILLAQGIHILYQTAHTSLALATFFSGYTPSEVLATSLSSPSFKKLQNTNSKGYKWNIALHPLMLISLHLFQTFKFLLLFLLRFSFDSAKLLGCESHS